MISYRKIVTLLHDSYGPQGWWPLIMPGQNGLCCHYIPDNSSRSLTNKEQFEIGVGAILTQNTNWTNAERALVSLITNGVLDPHILSSMDLSLLAELIRPSGYFNQKAKKIKAFSQFFLENPLPIRDIWLSLWGIGPETVDDILLYAYDVPVFVIDIYTKRLFSRLGHCNESVSYNDLQVDVTKGLDKDILLYKEYHALIVRHAKEHCRKKPSCIGCPLQAYCVYEFKGAL